MASNFLAFFDEAYAPVMDADTAKGFRVMFELMEAKMRYLKRPLNIVSVDGGEQAAERGGGVRPAVMLDRFLAYNDGCKLDCISEDAADQCRRLVSHPNTSVRNRDPVRALRAYDQIIDVLCLPAREAVDRNNDESGAFRTMMELCSSMMHLSYMGIVVVGRDSAQLVRRYMDAAGAQLVWVGTYLVFQLPLAL